MEACLAQFLEFLSLGVTLRRAPYGLIHAHGDHSAAMEGTKGKGARRIHSRGNATEWVG